MGLDGFLVRVAVIFIITTEEEEKRFGLVCHSRFVCTISIELRWFLLR